ncbi:MAG: hypothetical protein RO009_14435 [Pseudorhodoplanes sp.]|jgi:hypothetical protein|nr:hypothetical protein [Pseudorhodoplanes sp.]
MSALDRVVCLLALLMAVFGSVSLYAQAQELERQAAACHVQLRQFALYPGL